MVIAAEALIGVTSFGLLLSLGIRNGIAVDDCSVVVKMKKLMSRNPKSTIGVASTCIGCLAVRLRVGCVPVGHRLVVAMVNGLEGCVNRLKRVGQRQ